MTDLPSTIPNLPDRADDAELDKLASSSFLPRLQLMDRNSKPVVDDKIQAGRYAFIRSKDQVDDLTNTVECLVLARRAKALEIKKTGILSIYDTKDPEFSRIEAQSEVKDSGCSYGTEYLLWIRANRSFASFFCNSKTSRRSSADLNTVYKRWKGKEIPLPTALLKCSKKTNASYTWWGPDFSLCTTPFSELPKDEDCTMQVNKFNNPPKNEVETAEPVEQRG